MTKVRLSSNITKKHSKVKVTGFKWPLKNNWFEVKFSVWLWYGVRKKLLIFGGDQEKGSRFCSLIWDSLFLSYRTILMCRGFWQSHCADVHCQILDWTIKWVASLPIDPIIIYVRILQPDVETTGSWRRCASLQSAVFL